MPMATGAYDLTNGNADVQALGAGDSLTETFTVETIDGTEETVTITINGTDDAPESHRQLSAGL